MQEAKLSPETSEPESRVQSSESLCRHEVWPLQQETKEMLGRHEVCPPQLKTKKQHRLHSSWPARP